MSLFIIHFTYQSTQKAFQKKLGADIAPVRDEIQLDAKKLKELSEESGENIDEVKRKFRYKVCLPLNFVCFVRVRRAS